MTLLSDDVDNTPPADIKSYREELVGENKKFKTDEDLARGKFESDHFIEILKRQQDELRADYLKLKEESAAKAKLEELITKFEKVQPLTRNDAPPVSLEVKEPAIDPKQIESLIDSRISQRDLTKRQEENYNLVKGKLKEQFGTSYQTALKQQIDDLGISDKRLDEMARNEPQVLIKALGLDQTRTQETFQAPPRSNLRSDNFAPKGAQKRTWSYYQEMKKNDPKSYYDPKTNIRMHDDAIALGDAFKDGDFNRFN